MTLLKNIAKQITNLTTSLIKTSFQIEYNYISDKNGIISWDGYKDISFALKNLPYSEVYNECIKQNAFNFKLIDGAIIQLMYVCVDNEIYQHRLAFYPNPNTDRFQDNPENFEQDHFGIDLFSDIYEKRSIVFPLRFDFDKDEKKYIENDHTYSHLTLGNYRNCRIPVSRPITPNKFLLFILRSFYFDKFKAHYTNDDFKCTVNVGDSLLTDNEAQNIHLVC